jgi:hypothetical protein
MSDIHEGQSHTALGDVAARTLANATKTVPMLSTITPNAVKLRKLCYNTFYNLLKNKDKTMKPT